MKLSEVEGLSDTTLLSLAVMGLVEVENTPPSPGLRSRFRAMGIPELEIAKIFAAHTRLTRDTRLAGQGIPRTEAMQVAELAHLWALEPPPDNLREPDAAPR